MDAASQLKHYGSLSSTPLPGTSSPSFAGESVAFGHQSSTINHQSSTLNQGVPTGTMSESNWPNPPVSVNSTPPPITPSVAQTQQTAMVNEQRLMGNNPVSAPPIINHQPLTINHQSSSHFPFMIVTVLIMVALVGFGGSFIYFKSKGSGQNAIVAPLITPPVTIEPTSAVTEPTPNVNPFAPAAATVSANPFSEDEQGNPFDTVSDAQSATEAAYTNPFDN